MSTPRRITVATLVVGLAIMAPPDATAEVARATATREVTQKNLQFNPFELKVATGDTVVWSNRETDDTIHSVVQQGGSEINSPDIPPAGTFEWTFQEPGSSYQIVCRFHPDMFMTVEIAAAATAKPAKDKKKAPAKPPKPAPAAPNVEHGAHDAHAESAKKSKPAAPPGPPESTIPGVAGLPFATAPDQRDGVLR